MHNVEQLHRLHEQFPDTLVIIGVHSAKFPAEHFTENIREAVLRAGIEHPVVNDSEFRVWSEYNVNAWPTIVLIDPRGRIAWEQSGEIRAEDVAPVIEQLVAENAEIIDRTPLSTQPEHTAEPERVLRYPSKILAVENSLFIADSGHNRILQVALDPDGTSGEVVRVFGSGEPGLQDGVEDDTRFHHPRGMSLKGDVAQGTLYVADTENHAVRAIDLGSGKVRTVAGTGEKAYGHSTLAEPLQSRLRSPWDVLVLDQFLFIAMAGSHQIWLLTNEQQLRPFAGSGFEVLADGPLAQAGFNQPSGLALGENTLYVADPEASAIRAIRFDGEPVVETLVGTGLFNFGDQDGAGGQVLLQHSSGIDYGYGVIYIADTFNHKIKILDPTSHVARTLIGTGQTGLQDGSFHEARLREPEGVCVLGNRLFIADTDNHSVRVANLESEILATLTMLGLERLASPVHRREKTVWLDPVQVAPGELLIRFDVSLPSGYKRNPDIPATLHQPGFGDTPPLMFDPDEPIALHLQVAGDVDVHLNLTLYYCREGSEGLCLIHDRQLILPLQVQEGAPGAVRVQYSVEAPAEINR